jgi:RNA polymerase sigma-70 factor (ECF subfamily)
MASETWRAESSLEIESNARAGGGVPIISNSADVQSLSDEELLRRCANGQEAAMQELVQRYQGLLHGFLTRYLDSAEDTEQAVLNIFIRAWENAPRFQYRCQVSTWFYRIAINIAHDLHRNRTKRVPQEPWPATIERAAHPTGNAELEAFERLQRQDEFQALHRALDRMSETDRLLLVLYYFEERSYEEIQEIAQISYKVLKTRLTRARQRLRSLLETDDKKAMP